MLEDARGMVASFLNGVFTDITLILFTSVRFILSCTVSKRCISPAILDTMAASESDVT